ncbi:hypothetical protein MITS9509_03495 [Synechococcus sp. MIT S9509]|uniref:hypothetical protein n=1 Tax=Synechococcus sp. MIT S9509 TaxID=1801630 RepID=UPI0007BC4532|nr:hypothetical protein [Synechococcus sp. MIT S9509]KZR86256.1 hypothetical protein MITS9509_03495 [Synechococcus sp. MIT S9509]
MKFLASACVALVAISGAAIAQNAPGCYPDLAVNDFNKMTRGGATQSRALALSLNQNFDGSESCKYKINDEFISEDMPAPFQ